MKNSKKLEKSRGILAFACNTKTTNYIDIAEKTLELASKKLNLPYTLITNISDDRFTNSRFDIDSNTFVKWRNFNRYTAYELSPYDETIVIDVDYVVVDSALLDIFELSWDYLLQRNSHALTTNWPNSMGNLSLPYVWATVFAFRKTDKASMFFNLIKRIQENYFYYRTLFNIQERNFRNDYAFSIADIVLNGFSLQQQTIPGSMLAIDQKINHIELKNNFFVVRDDQTAFVLPKTNLHVMSKEYLQSKDFHTLVDTLLNDNT